MKSKKAYLVLVFAFFLLPIASKACSSDGHLPPVTTEKTTTQDEPTATTPPTIQTEPIPSKPIPPPSDYRQAMRNLVQGISGYAKGIKPNFIVIANNGEELFTEDGKADGLPINNYTQALNGFLMESVFYGYPSANTSTSTETRNYVTAYLDRIKGLGVQVLVIDYCNTQSYINDSYALNKSKGYISFASMPALNTITTTTPFDVNSSNIHTIASAKNFLYIIDAGQYEQIASFISAIKTTNFDLVFIDAFFGSTLLTSSDVSQLKTKANGGTRLVLAYMNIGEAENYRYYWKPEWNTTPPPWIHTQNPNYPDSFTVKYWEKTWQDIIFGSDSSYLKKIIDAGFDGVLLDVVDVFERF